MRSIAVFLLLVSLETVASDLVRHWNGDTTLSDEDLIQLSERVLSNETAGNYSKALAYFYMGYLKDQPMDKLAGFFNSLESMAQADTADAYLEMHTWTNVGNIYERYRLYEEATDAYLNARRIVENMEDNEHMLVLARYNMAKSQAYHDPDRAIASYYSVIELANTLEDKDKYLTVVHKRLGLLYQQAEEYDLAVDHLTRALEFAPSGRQKAAAYHNLAGAYYYTGDIELQEENLRKSLELREGASRFRSLLDLGECLIRQDRLSDARKVLLEAETFFEDQSPGLNRIKLYKWLRASAPTPEEALAYADVVIDQTEEFTNQTLDVQGVQRKEALRTALAKYRNDQTNVVNDTFLGYLWKILLLLGVVIVFLIFVIRKLVGRSEKGEQNVSGYAS